MSNSPSGAEEIISRLHEESNMALSRGDVDSVMEVYSDDVISMPPNQLPLEGKAAVRSMWENLLADFSVDASVSVDEVIVNGNWAFERGRWKMTLTPKDEKSVIQDDGTYLDIVQKQLDGEWKYARVSWSSNHPAS